MATQMGNTQAHIVNREDGTRLFCLKENDDSAVDVVLTDLMGRKKHMTVPDSTIMLMLPTGVLGAMVFDPLIGPNGVLRDTDDNRPIFTQRPPMARVEVFEMIQEDHTRRGGILGASATEAERLGRKLVFPGGR